MTPQLTTIELFKEDMKFSVGHFTVFSSTERENLHGHNYTLHVSFVTEVKDEGLSFDYRYYKKTLRDLCDELDETVIMPGLCRHLEIVENEKHYLITFNRETMMFLKRDILILPIKNVTVEELSGWFLQKMISDLEQLLNHCIVSINIKLYSGPGQCGSATWLRSFMTNAADPSLRSGL